MRIFLIGDVHGNLEALNSVFRDMKTNYIPSFLKKKNDKTDILGNLGDLIGYMPNPNEVVEKVTAVSTFNLPGNHDIAVIDRSAFEFNETAEWAINWTNENINSKVRKKLETICKDPGAIVKMDRSIFAHSTPHKPEYMNYIEGVMDATFGFFEHERFKGMHGFVGHRHIPQFYYSPLRGEFDPMKVKYDPIEFDRAFLRQIRILHLDNVESSLTVIPSVGQPRDGNPLSGYAIYYPKEEKIEIIRIPYNITLTQNKMIKLNFPERLIQRLDFGR